MAYKKAQKPGVLLYWEVFDAFEAMLDGDAKRMLSAIRMYAQYGELPNFDDNPGLRMAWVLTKSKLDKDSARYEEICRKRSEAGKSGAATKWGDDQNR